MSKRKYFLVMVSMFFALIQHAHLLNAKSIFQHIHNPFSHHHHKPKVKKTSRARRRMLSIFKKHKEKPSDEALVQKNEHPPIQKKVILQTKDGLERVGILTFRKNARGNIIMCHPAAYDKSFMIPYEEKVFSFYNCLRFDFRRHGENSAGQCSTIGKREVFEVEAALEILKQHPETKNLPTYGFGVSMGAATLIEAEQKLHAFDGLILQAPFASLRDQIRRSLPLFDGPIVHNFIFREPVRLYAKLKYNIRLCKVYPERSIKNVTCPIFLMHAKNDDVVPFEHFCRIKKSGNSIIATWTPKAGQHTALFKTFPDLYTKKCNAFLNYVSRTRGHLNYIVTHNQLSQLMTLTTREFLDYSQTFTVSNQTPKKNPIKAFG